MTAFRTEPQLVGGLVALPRVNLLPAEIAGVARFRRLQMGLAVALLGAVGTVGLAWNAAGGSVSAAQEQLDSASADHVRVQRQVEGFRGVTQVYTRVAAAESALRTAMSGEVRYSAMLDDLAGAVPSNIWLTDAAFSDSSAAPTSSAVAPAANSSSRSLSLKGKALEHDDVAGLLDVLAHRKGLGQPVLQSQSETRIGGHVVVDWSLTVPVTDAALSGRYTRTGS